MSSSPGNLVVLVHGAFHGAWCWAALQAELDRRGVPSMAVDLPGHGASTEELQNLHGDAAAVARLVAKLDRDVVLVGHSYGGAVIGQADTGPHVTHLVFVAAMVVDVGESSTGLAAGLPPVQGAGARLFARMDDGTLTARPDLAAACFYNRCGSELAAAAVPRLDAQRASTLKQPADRARWREVPSTYVLCTDDQVVPPAAQEILAVRCGTTVRLDADHSPFLGQPAAVADILEPLARG